MNFYNYYLLLCQQKGESPSGAAQKMSLSKTAVNNWKKGGLPSDITLFALALHFNVPIEEFWKCEDIAKKRESYPQDEPKEKTATINGDGVGEYTVSAEDKRLLTWFRSLSPEKQKAILISQDAPEDLF